MGAGKGKARRIQANQETSSVFQNKIKKPLVKTMIGLSLAGVLIGSGCGAEKSVQSVQSPAHISGNSQVERDTLKHQSEPTNSATGQEKETFGDQVDALRKRMYLQSHLLRREISRLDISNDAHYNYGDLVSLYGQLLPMLKKYSSELQSLTPPPEDEAIIATYKETLVNYIKAVDAYIGGSASDDTTLIPKLRNGLNRDSYKLREAAKAYKGLWS